MFKETFVYNNLMSYFRGQRNVIQYQATKETAYDLLRDLKHAGAALKLLLRLLKHQLETGKLNTRGQKIKEINNVNNG
jgi:hypothetical protein